MMVTSGMMTHRIDQLEKAGLVTRIHHPKDGRSVIISLTDRGLTLVDAAVGAHVATLAGLTSGLSCQERASLEGSLAKFLKGLEENGPAA